MGKLKEMNINTIICLIVLILFSGLKDLSAQNYVLTENIDNYSSTMTITAVVKNKEIIQHNLEIGVFVDDECRCVRNLTGDNEKLFLTVKGEEVAPFYFKVYLHDENEKREVVINPYLNFKPDSIMGSSSDPYVIQIDRIITDLESKEQDIEPVRIYPTIGNHGFIVDTQELCNLSIYNLNGNKIYFRQVNGKFESTDINLPSGMYIVNVDAVNNTFVTRQKILIK